MGAACGAPLQAAARAPARGAPGWFARAAAAVLTGALTLGPLDTAGQSAAALAGERLFSGDVRLANGGPPCAACHAAAGLPFPGGGDLGPDLSDAYSKFGPEPLDLVLTTLFFPTMNPIFNGRPLTPAERADLVAFFAASGGRAPATGVSLRLLLYGLLLAAVAAALVAWLGRTRLRGVRAGLVRARRSREVTP